MRHCAKRPNAGGWLLHAVLLAFCAGLIACADDKPTDPPQGVGPQPSAQSQDLVLTIMAGSESEAIAPIIQSCATRLGIGVRMHYSGSVDMMLALKQPDFPFDAVMPASSIWLRLGDAQWHRIKEEASIMRSPVGLGIRQSLARKLDWIGKDVRVQQILEAVQSKKIQFAMTSATQSNSGFSSYIGMLTALAGNPDVLTAEHLNRPYLRESIRNLLDGEVEQPQRPRHAGLRSLALAQVLEHDEVVHGRVPGRGPVDGCLHVQVAAPRGAIAALQGDGLAGGQGLQGGADRVLPLVLGVDELIGAHADEILFGIPQQIQGRGVRAQDGARRVGEVDAQGGGVEDLAIGGSRAAGVRGAGFLRGEPGLQGL